MTAPKPTPQPQTGPKLNYLVSWRFAAWLNVFGPWTIWPLARMATPREHHRTLTVSLLFLHLELTREVTPVTVKPLSPKDAKEKKPA